MKKLLYISTLLLSCLLLYSCYTNDNGLETTVAEQTVTAEETTVAEETTDSLTSTAPEETTIEETEAETTAEETTIEETTAEETTAPPSGPQMAPMENYCIFCGNDYMSYVVGFHYPDEVKELRTVFREKSDILVEEVFDIDKVYEIITEHFEQAVAEYGQEQREEWEHLRSNSDNPEKFEDFKQHFEILNFHHNPQVFYIRKDTGGSTYKGQYIVIGTIDFNYYDSYEVYERRGMQISEYEEYCEPQTLVNSFSFVDTDTSVFY